MGKIKIDGASFYCESSLHVKLYDILYSGAAAQYRDIDFYEALANDSRIKILDAACGTGRIFNELANDTRIITAFDASDELLNVARSKLLEFNHSVSIHHAYLETFDFNEQFDLIIVGYYGFSYLLTEDKQVACLKAIRKHLAPGGLTVLHLPKPDLLSRDVPQHEIDSMKAKIQLLDQGNQYVLDFQVLSMRYDAELKVRTVSTELSISDLQGKRLVSETKEMHYAYIDQQDLMNIARVAGLKIDRLSQGFTPDAVSELVVILSAQDVDVRDV